MTQPNTDISEFFKKLMTLYKTQGEDAIREELRNMGMRNTGIEKFLTFIKQNYKSDDQM